MAEVVNRRRVHVLHPGDVALATRGEVLQTLLGSCVSVILTDPRRTVAAMCHIVHAGLRDGAAPRSGADAEGARAQMHRLLTAQGIQPRLCEAFVYGGGNMFPALLRGQHVGAANVQRVIDLLSADSNRIVRQDVGGATYRRLSWTVGRDDPTVTAVEVDRP